MSGAILGAGVRKKNAIINNMNIIIRNIRTIKETETILFSYLYFINIKYLNIK
ncbi:Hypothetical protein ORPV_1117 [Orpheovirus IHUMI-LCC2]|uniref:Uncharacterized protein n=1 Tax=Orpheovirus IHUMI-LCC2 TaxID=2023057 RepID=A0A2I2L680_9VIRU|nr:Hypothetical protein ORPV_1117 [Orpheovirus IHUMI-LCC2]SNW63021.1 Hypothetical protein ORPV_1117 [Orpheovirus IHUMI-LCC2]